MESQSSGKIILNPHLDEICEEEGISNVEDADMNEKPPTPAQNGSASDDVSFTLEIENEEERQPRSSIHPQRHVHTVLTAPSILDGPHGQSSWILIDDSDEENRFWRKIKRTSTEEIGSDVEIISIDEEEYKESFEGSVRIGSDYQVTGIPKAKPATDKNLKKEKYMLLICWAANELPEDKGK